MWYDGTTNSTCEMRDRSPRFALHARHGLLLAHGSSTGGLRPIGGAQRVWMPPANSGTRARAPLPSLRPLQVLLVHGGYFGVLLYIVLLGPRRWILVLRDLQCRNTILS
jgi:hypothetical protein